MAEERAVAGPMDRLQQREVWDLASLADLVSSSSAGVVVADADHVVVLANEQAAAVLGVSLEELVGSPVLRYGREAMQGFSTAALTAVADLGVEVTVRDASVGGGSERATVDMTISRAMTDTGPLSVMSLREGPDRSDQIRLFRGLLEAAPDGMVIVDTEGVIQLVNAQAEALFGYERAELIGEPIEMLVPDRLSGMHMAFRSGYLADPVTRPMSLASDMHARRKDGSEFPVEVSLGPVQTDRGLLVSAAVRDTSERKRMQEETDRIKDEFFATVSHELRTPLTSIVGYGELMTDLEELTPQGRRFLSVIMRSADRELRLVDDLLTLVAIEESGLAIRSAEIDLERVARDAVEAARLKAEEAELTLTLETPGYAISMFGDRDRLGQAIDNLLSNAIKFTPQGGRVRVVLRESGSTAEIDVVDTGIGIGDEDPDALFERLFRSGNAIAQQTPGAGLGLTIALAIVEAHAGTIEVVESSATGSTFRLTFPLRRPSEY